MESKSASQLTPGILCGAIVGVIPHLLFRDFFMKVEKKKVNSILNWLDSGENT